MMDIDETIQINSEDGKDFDCIISESTSNQSASLLIITHKKKRIQKWRYELAIAY